MAVTGQTGRTSPNTIDAGGLQATAQNYTSLGTLLDPTKPDVMDLYVATYGDQGITGFLDLTGAKKNAGTSDEVEWFEEGRLHSTVAYVFNGGTGALSNRTDIGVVVRVNDVLLLADGQRVVVKSMTDDVVTAFSMSGRR